MTSSMNICVSDKHGFAYTTYFKSDFSSQSGMHKSVIKRSSCITVIATHLAYVVQRVTDINKLTFHMFR